MNAFEKAGRLCLRSNVELVSIEAWGKNALRVRCTHLPDFQDQNWALMEDVTADNHPVIEIGANEASIANGTIRAVINVDGWLTFYQGEKELLSEYNRDRRDVLRYCVPINVFARELVPNLGHDDYALTARFEAYPDERIYGMGQYQDLALNKKGSILELAHRNTQSSVPFYVSSRGYGFLWNNPAVGKVAFGANRTEWEAPYTKELDYWICAGNTPAEIVEIYTSVTGRPPMMPEYGMGYWQSRMRYRSQEELMSVARRHHELGLPLDVIVADFFHWPIQGDFRFDERIWPDVDGMVRELKKMGTELMVSVWPTVDERSENYREMYQNGFLMQNDRGMGRQMGWDMGDTSFYDTTHPGARKFVWEKAKKSYYEHGIRIFWLDEAEPEIKNYYNFDIYRYHQGPARQVTNLYPKCFAQGFYEGMKAEGQDEIVNLVRCAWAGSQRYGALVWSGDVHSSFRSMREQLSVGLSMGMAGIPWWDCDIGGFLGGKTDDPAFRELLSRWFAWGAFMPVMRMHGNRLPKVEPEEEYIDGIHQMGTGFDNEVWSFGPEVFEIIKKYIFLRERLRPYTRRLMQEAHETGAPLMRPLFYEFPDDKKAWEEESAYMYGSDLLVAPVMEAKVDSRTVYLPKGANWTEAATGKVFEGGQAIEAYAPIDVIPVFIRDGAEIKVY